MTEDFYYCYRKQRFEPGTLDIINKTNQFVEEYAGMGYTLTLRQLYYRFIARDAFPDSWIDRLWNLKHGLDPNTKNAIKNYKRLGEMVKNGREAGLISWTAFEDRNRTLYATPVYEDADALTEGIEHSLALDYWRDQPVYVEVYVEKDALGPIVGRAASEWKARHMACKGYLSASQAWRAGQRFQRAMESGKRGILVHVGDHDPSGKDMTRDNLKRITLYSEGPLEINRVALNMDQIKARNPPPNPVKVTDTRYKRYMAEFGDKCWELDALEPQELHEIVASTVEGYIDKKAWDAVRKKEAQERLAVRTFFDGVRKHKAKVQKLIDKENAKQTKRRKS